MKSKNYFKYILSIITIDQINFPSPNEKIKKNIPRKRVGASKYSKAMGNFYAETLK